MTRKWRTFALTASRIVGIESSSPKLKGNRIMLTGWRMALVTALCTVACSQSGLAQRARLAPLQIDVENVARYTEDISDVSKFATNPNVVSAAVPKNFGLSVFIGDIVAVNGQPAKGTFVNHGRTINLRPNPIPGNAIADTNRNAIADFTFEILDANGTPIGTIMGFGLTVGAPPPGAPSAVTQGNNTIVGGTGAYLGVRGYFGDAVASQPVPIRLASMSEDPANRRMNGGGKLRFVLQVIPLTPPGIVAVTHANDFSLVTQANPARSGEVLTLWATGLDAMPPEVDPALTVVNSPVEVKVNGTSAEVLYAGRFPEAADAYRVDIRLPTEITLGKARLQVMAAWIAGAQVTIAIE